MIVFFDSALYLGETGMDKYAFSPQQLIQQDDICNDMCDDICDDIGHDIGSHIFVDN